MEKMKRQDGHALSAEDTAQINGMMTWLADHGYNGIMLVHKGDAGVFWMSEPDAEAVRHLLMNSVGHIAKESKEAARILLRGMMRFLHDAINE